MADLLLPYFMDKNILDLYFQIFELMKIVVNFGVKFDHLELV
jgi:hypothetical protein